MDAPVARPFFSPDFCAAVRCTAYFSTSTSWPPKAVTVRMADRALLAVVAAAA